MRYDTNRIRKRNLITLTAKIRFKSFFKFFNLIETNFKLFPKNSVSISKTVPLKKNDVIRTEL